MDIRKLNAAFYDENAHLKEVLDNAKGNWVEGKTRGYGIVIINLNNLRFGLPFRSNLREKNGYYINKPKGLDFSKSVILHLDKYISDQAFKIPKEEFTKLREEAHIITDRFEKYVTRYVTLQGKGHASALKREYTYTTLINYHEELGI